MNLILEPHAGAGWLRFGDNRRELRARLAPRSFITKVDEPENDRYEQEGLILGYDGADELEFIEMVPPSVAEYRGVEFFSLNLPALLRELEILGLAAPFRDGGYDFREFGTALYCPPDAGLGSVALYRRGYYDELEL